MKAGALSAIHKELIALQIGVAGDCKGCIAFYTKLRARPGAAHEQVMETLAVAVYQGGGPALMYAAEAATNAYDAFAQSDSAAGSQPQD